MSLHKRNTFTTVNHTDQTSAKRLYHASTATEGNTLATLRINHDGLARHRRRAKIHDDHELARMMGVDYSTLHRVLSGKSSPGIRFIGGAVALFGSTSFAQLFDVVGD